MYLDRKMIKKIQEKARNINESMQTVLWEFLAENNCLNFYFTSGNDCKEAIEEFNYFVEKTKEEKVEVRCSLKSDQAMQLFIQDQHKLVNSLKSDFKIDWEVKVSNSKVSFNLSGISANMKNAQEKVKKFIEK